MIDPEQIARNAEAAFPVEPVPAPGVLSNDHCPECVEVSEAYGVRPWTQVRAAEIVGHETALLGATAWRYYLPAMITLCVREPDALDVLPDYLVYQLEPPEPEKSDEWFKERASGFTPAQRAVVVEYLEWYRAREEQEYAEFQTEPPPHVYRALEYWTTAA